MKIPRLKWQQYLMMLHNHNTFVKANWEEGTDVTSMMKKKYPGNYELEEYYDPEIMRFTFRLVFESPQEESLWMLKNSNN